MSQRAVVIIDLQNEYLPAGNLPLTGIEQAVTNAAKVIADARAKGLALIMSATSSRTDLGYSVTVVHDACVTLDLEFGGVTVPAAQVHATRMAALGFAYASLESTDEYLAG